MFCLLLHRACSLVCAGVLLLGLSPAVFSETGVRELPTQQRNDAVRYHLARSSKTSASNQSSWFYTGLEANYVLLNTADVITTFYGLAHGAQEANPIANSFIQNRPVTLALKTTLTIGTLWGLRQVRKESRVVATVTLGALNVLYGLVVANNIRVVVGLSK